MRRKAQKKKELERRLKERQEVKAQAMAAKSPEKKEKKSKSTPYQGETIVDMDGNVTKEPNYKQIRLSKDQ